MSRRSSDRPRDAHLEAFAASCSENPERDDPTASRDTASSARVDLDPFASRRRVRFRDGAASDEVRIGAFLPLRFGGRILS
jgi:hypothetical protein